MKAKFIKIRDWFNANEIIKISFSILVLVIVLIIYITNALDKNYLLVSYFVLGISLIIISFYNIESIFMGYLMITIIFGFLFIRHINDDVLLEAESTNLKKTEKLTFYHQNKKIGADSSDFIVFYGYKHIVMGSRRSNKKIDNEYRIFATEDINNISYSKIKF